LAFDTFRAIWLNGREISRFPRNASSLRPWQYL